MLYDLNVAWSPTTTDDQLLALLSLASSLGYATVALNHTLNLPFPANPKAPFPALPTARSSSTSSTGAASSSRSQRLPHVLHRATLPLADPAASNYRLPDLVNAYDLLAIRPLTEKAFQNACLTLDIPLISLDMAQHFPFHFRPRPCMAAVARGVRFEICYAQALLARDPRARANFIGNVTSLFRATRGRGIIISSEAPSSLALRAPADVINLLGVWGLPNDKAMEALRSVPRSVVVNEGIKRNGFRGVIDVVQVAKASERRDGAQDPADGQNDKAKNSKGQVAGSDGAKSQKRKNALQEDGSQTLSKRQMKKMKLAARTGGPTAS
ncbi:putative ribonuclease P protein subunit 3 [Paramyrothecium foliicola]|nr:putative ribonuclease P protein subunit 3 [Paramyrothecium foliicola]